MLAYEHEFSSSSLENFHLPLVRSQTFVELECVEDVGTLLLKNMSLLRGKYVKTILCQESHHMILMSASTTAACVPDVQDHIKLI